MPRFYFHVDGRREEEGVELPSLAEAKCQAVRFAGQLICDNASEFWDTSALSIVVTDETGLTLFTLDFLGTEAPAIRHSRKP